MANLKYIRAILDISAGLQDTHVTTPIKLGDASNASLNTTNKTLVGAINELEGSQETLKLSETTSTPSTPASGESVIYEAADKNLYYLNENGVPVQLNGSGGGGSSTLSGLSDVSLASPTANDALMYDSVTSKWKNRNTSFIKSSLNLSKSDVGLSNVDNTSDVNKPISTAAQTALDLKQNKVSGAVSGNIAGLDSTGQTTDLGKNFNGNDGTNNSVVTWADNQSYITQALLNTPSLPFVQFATTANDALSGLSARDGYTPTAGNICLVKNQTTVANNGPYIVASGAWTRAKYNTTTLAWEAITTETTYSQLNIQSGIINVLNGTTNKNLQYQISITNTSATFGNSTVYVTATTKLPQRDVYNGYVNTNIGNNTNNNGTASFPYSTVAQDLTGASYPHITNVAASGASYSENISLTSSNPNLTLQCLDSSVAGKCQFTGTLTMGSGTIRYREFGITRSTGASVPFNFSSATSSITTLENCIVTTSSGSVLTLGSGMIGWLDLINVDFTGSTALGGSIPLPNFTSAFTINIYRQSSAKPIIFSAGTGTGTNLTINVYNSGKGCVWLPAGFTGAINYFDSYNVNQVITDQSTLTSVLSSTVLLGYYAVSFASPSGMPAGGIFLKYTGVSGGFLIENFSSIPASIYDYNTKQIFTKNGSGSFNGWFALASSATIDTTNASNITSGTLPNARLSSVPNSSLANSTISIAGSSVSLGDSITQDQITGLSTTGLVKRTASNTLSIAVANTDYLPATSGSSIQKANGLGGLTNAVSGTDYQAPITQNDIYVKNKLIILPGSNITATTSDANNTITLSSALGGDFSSDITSSTQYSPVVFADTLGKTGTKVDTVSKRRAMFRAINIIGSFTTSERDSLSSWNTNEIIYNITINRQEIFNGTAWVSLDADIGKIVPFTNTVSDSKYLLADGSAISRTTYSEYFAKINPNIATTYSCTFTSGNTTITSGVTLVVGDGYRLRFTTTTGGVTVGTTYFVKVLTSTTFAIATTFANLRAGTYFSPTGSGASTFTQSPYGFGDGSTTFNLPDLRGTFLRGLDTTSTYDLDGGFRQIGGLQFDQFKSHFHQIAYDSSAGFVSTNQYPSSIATANDNTSRGLSDRNITGYRDGAPTRGNWIGNTGGNQTNPYNIAINYYIKVL